MNTRFNKFLSAALLFAMPYSTAYAEGDSAVLTANQDGAAASSAANPPALIKAEKNWYFSWGYSRQYYAPSDIHVTQPSQGNNFTVHKAKADDFATNPIQTLESIANLEFTGPQENVRVGRFMNPEKTFALEFSLDHSKYNTIPNQTAYVSGTRNGQPYNANLQLTAQNFDYKLHNGLNHIMINAVWLNHLYGPVQKKGDLELISRAGAGILLPHAENTIFGNANQVGPKNQNICCFASNDWWQINGWTAGVEVGVRYRITESLYLELTAKEAYGFLRSVPVYQGTADQEIWMTEGIFSLGYLF